MAGALFRASLTVTLSALKIVGGCLLIGLGKTIIILEELVRGGGLFPAHITATLSALKIVGGCLLIGLGKVITQYWE